MAVSKVASTREAPVCKMLAKKEALGAFVPSIFIRSREGSCFYFISEEETSQRASHEEFLFSEYRRRAFIRSEREGEHFQGSFHSAKCFHMSTLAVRGNVVSNYIPIILRVMVTYIWNVQRKRRSICVGVTFDGLDRFVFLLSAK